LLLRDDPRVWGATATECAADFPCDTLDAPCDETLFRAISIAAPVALVFRWLCQLRVAPYSYDLIDNFGRRSPPRLTAGIERLEAGQRIMVIFRLVAFEPDRSLSIRLDSRLGRAIMGDLAGSYVVTAAPGGCRLVAKVRVRYPRGTYGRILRVVMPYADLIMFRKQLRTFRTYAERDAGTNVHQRAKPPFQEYP
jgi:hypothetical protein